jgi:hypothetical protein
MCCAQDVVILLYLFSYINMKKINLLFLICYQLMKPVIISVYNLYSDYNNILNLIQLNLF